MQRVKCRDKDAGTRSSDAALPVLFLSQLDSGVERAAEQRQRNTNAVRERDRQIKDGNCAQYSEHLLNVGWFTKKIFMSITSPRQLLNKRSYSPATLIASGPTRRFALKLTTFKKNARTPFRISHKLFLDAAAVSSPAASDALLNRCHRTRSSSPV
jgi:hypothetical protein